MKTKKIVFCLFLGIIYMACNDTIGRVGLSIQPDEDKVSVFDTTIFVDARTIEVDSLYAKTPNGLLGEIYDPSYGDIKSSYICQYYPSLGFPYIDSIKDNTIDSVKLHLSYSAYIGDSLAPMEVTVYPVVKTLDNHYYTNVNPKDFCDMDHPLARYTYTARNYTISDSSLQASNYSYYISIPLPVKIGQDYLEKVRNNEIKTLDDFLNFFPGTYLTTTFGTGSMLPVDMTDITLFYTRWVTLQKVDGGDSLATVVSTAIFNVTKEVTQLNRFENKNPSFLTDDNPDKTYIKSPAGVFTEITIPIKEIVKGIGRKKFSGVALSLKAYPRDNWAYSLQFPGAPNSLVPLLSSDGSTGCDAKMLLIEPDSVANFFEMKKIADGQTSYTAQFNFVTYTYDFNNIANVVQNAIDKAPDKDLKLWMIPVMTTWVSQTNVYGSTSHMDYMTSNYLYPSGVTLKKGSDNLKVRVIATDLTINN